MGLVAPDFRIGVELLPRRLPVHDHAWIVNVVANLQAVELTAQVHENGRVATAPAVLLSRAVAHPRHELAREDANTAAAGVVDESVGHLAPVLAHERTVLEAHHRVRWRKVLE